MNETKLKNVIRKTIINTMENSNFSQDEEEFLIVAGWDEINDFEKEIVKFLAKYTEDEIEDIGLKMAYFSKAGNKEEYGRFFDDCMSFLGTEWGFSDEYTLCNDCYRVIRISPNSYSWTPDYVLGDGYIICNECARDNKEDYINEFINNPRKAVTWLSEIEVEKMGFKQINEEKYETGFHAGQNDSPEKEFDKFKNQYEEIVFTIYSQGQFDTHWNIWGRNLEK